jgi:hypothetical protein
MLNTVTVIVVTTWVQLLQDLPNLLLHHHHSHLDHHHRHHLPTVITLPTLVTHIMDQVQSLVIPVAQQQLKEQQLLRTLNTQDTVTVDK